MHDISDLTDDGLDQMVRDALELDPAVLANARTASLELTGSRLDDAIAREGTVTSLPSRRRRPVRPMLIASAAASIAIAVIAVSALAPSGKHAGTGSFDAFAPSSAGASEVLRLAAAVVRKAPAARGTGPVWHSVRKEGGQVMETWLDPSTGATRVAQADAGSGVQGVQGIYLILDRAADGTRHTRYYERRSQSWSASPGLQSNDGPSTNEDHLFDEDVSRYVRALDRASNQSEIAAATSAYLAQPRRDLSTPGGRSDADARQLMRGTAILMAITTAPVQPAALAELYRTGEDLGTLKRLPDRTLDGRPVLAVQLFQPVDEHEQSVLLLDGRTAVPVAVTTPHGTSVQHIQAPERTQQVGGSPASCRDGSDELPPCSLLDGTDPVAHHADALAAQGSTPPASGMDAAPPARP